MKLSSFLRFIENGRAWDYWRPDEGGYTIVFWWNGDTRVEPSHQQHMEDYIVLRLGLDELLAAVKRGRKNDYTWPTTNYVSGRAAAKQATATAAAQNEAKTGRDEKGRFTKKEQDDETGVPAESG